ncbi:MAG: DUF1697 domain-containing protein [Thermomicrobiales bacterium]
MGIQVAFFRGLNVGKSTRIAMRDLIGAFEALGCTSVRSYVQSGNVVFVADASLVSGIGEAIEQRMKSGFGVRTWVTLRDLDAMRAIVSSNPFLDLNAPPTSVAVAFHRSNVELAFDDSALADRVEHRGSETWLYLPNGFSGTNLPASFFAKQLGEATTRNWRTVTKVLEMMEALV